MKKPEIPSEEKAAVAEAAKVKKNADALVNGFVPSTDFRAKPFGPDGPEMAFKAGIPSSPVPQAFIDSLSDKKVSETAADNG